ncbi:unnamed protein product [Colias eurytheme]|nr:unnamed protein product [Colias eurytheme]
MAFGFIILTCILAFGAYWTTKYMIMPGEIYIKDYRGASAVTTPATTATDETTIGSDIGEITEPNIGNNMSAFDVFDS